MIDSEDVKKMFVLALLDALEEKFGKLNLKDNTGEWSGGRKCRGIVSFPLDVALHENVHGVNSLENPEDIIRQEETKKEKEARMKAARKDPALMAALQEENEAAKALKRQKKAKREAEKKAQKPQRRAKKKGSNAADASGSADQIGLGTGSDAGSANTTPPGSDVEDSSEEDADPQPIGGGADSQRQRDNTESDAGPSK